ncbi:MAG: DUF4388 domain-containing protein [Planctomycetota bacterium]|jgi:hypothetical protein
MAEQPTATAPSEGSDLTKDLQKSVCALVSSLVNQSEEQANEDFEHLMSKARHLFERKQSMEGTKSQTRDLLGELLFSRMRRSFREFLGGEDAKDEIRAAEWALGVLVAGKTLNEFAGALDRAILEQSAPRDYSFAGRADFISLEEVLQLLGSGKHMGCLSLERHDNRIDIYLNGGQVAFLDPHHLERRILPGVGPMNYREISLETMAKAEKDHADTRTPLFLALEKLGEFKELDIKSVMRQVGCEVFYDFLRAQGECNFHYRQLDTLPDFAVEKDLRLGITPILLEGNKRVDDWRSLIKVFPDPDQPIEPVPDMHAKIAGLNLGVMEIKLLAQLNNENSPRMMVELMGLPLMDVYTHLVRFALEGAIVPPGGIESLHEASMTLEESMALAFEALDANDSGASVGTALDKVLGGDETPSLVSPGKLDFLKAAREGEDD